MGNTNTIKTLTQAYNVLGFSVEVDNKELKKAYRKLSKQYHPDMPTGDAQKFSLIAEAYSCLTDEDLKAKLMDSVPRYEQTNGYGPTSTGRESYIRKPFVKGNHKKRPIGRMYNSHVGVVNFSYHFDKNDWDYRSIGEMTVTHGGILNLFY